MKRLANDERITLQPSEANDEKDIKRIALLFDDNEIRDYEVLTIIEHDGAQYVALAEQYSDEYDALRIGEWDDMLSFSIITDDAEYEAVCAKFDAIFSQEG